VALIIDTGPLLAAMNKRDAAHKKCAQLIAQCSERLIIPSPVLIEVDYFLTKHRRQNAFYALLHDVEQGHYIVENLLAHDYRRVKQIYSTYSDTQVGFVDAAVLTITERLGEKKLATLDHRHFGVMRPAHINSLQLLP
jgi:predicted nucleic acid-binding protein